MLPWSIGGVTHLPANAKFRKMQLCLYLSHRFRYGNESPSRKRFGRRFYLTSQEQSANSALLHHPCLLGGPKLGEMATSPLPSRVPMVGRNQYGYIIPAFSESPWWGEINLVRSGCGGNKQKMHENG